MEAIANVLIFGFIIWLNITLGKRKKLKMQSDKPDEEEDTSAMEEIRQKVRSIKAEAYWQQFRERIVPLEFILDDEEPDEDLVLEEKASPTIDTPEEIIPVAIMEEDPEKRGDIFNLGKTEIQRGIILAEILSPCLAKRKSAIRRI